MQRYVIRRENVAFVKKNFLMRIRRYASCFLYCIGLVAFSFSAQADEKGHMIMQSVYDQSHTFKHQESAMAMEILDASERKRDRFFTLKQRIDKEISHSLAKFFKPTDVKGVGLLSQSFEDGAAPSQWLFFPALKSVKRLSAQEQNGSFMGSDFSFKDVAGRTVNQDTHTLLRENEKLYLIESIPNDKEDSYSKLLTTVDKKNNIIRKVVFFDREGEKLKTLTNREIQKIQDIPTVVFTMMENHKTGSTSSLRRSNIKTTIKFSDNDIGLKGLRAG